MNKKSEIIINGNIISSGLAIGKACHFQIGQIDQAEYYQINKKDINKELSRFNHAIELSKKELTQLTHHVKNMLGEKEAKIFETHVALLDDNQLKSKIENKISKEYINVEYAVKVIFEEYEEVFANMEDEYMRDRETDFLELKRRVLSHLTGKNGQFVCDLHCMNEHSCERIVIAKEFTTSMISLLKSHDIKGIITEYGGKNSHAAILSRAAGIPFISNIKTNQDLKCGADVVMDAEKGTVYIHATKERVEKFYQKIKQEKEIAKQLEKNHGPVVTTKNQLDIEIFANIMNLNEMKYVNHYQLAGVGLLRTEFLFFDHIEFPTIDEQADIYSKIVKSAKNRPVTFRLFDFGGDKHIRSLVFPDEENPLLGLRGIRFLLKNKKILEDQVKAICAVEKFGNIKILIPMITTIEELIEVKKIIMDILKQNHLKKKIPIGMMFEVPSVLLDYSDFLREIDFASIGTNDLVQYLFGVDRNNPYVSHLYNQDSQVIYKLFKRLSRAANENNVDLSICGEINFKTPFIENIIEAGIRKISLAPIGAPRAIERIKKVSGIIQ